MLIRYPFDIMYTKYQDVSVKAVEQVEFPVYALPLQH